MTMELNIASLVTPLLTVGLRVSGLMLFAPLFGSAAIPVRIKAVLVIAVTAVLSLASGAYRRRTGRAMAFGGHP